MTTLMLNEFVEKKAQIDSQKEQIRAEGRETSCSVKNAFRNLKTAKGLK